MNYWLCVSQGINHRQIQFDGSDVMTVVKVNVTRFGKNFEAVLYLEKL